MMILGQKKIIAAGKKLQSPKLIRLGMIVFITIALFATVLLFWNLKQLEQKIRVNHNRQQLVLARHASERLEENLQQVARDLADLANLAESPAMRNHLNEGLIASFLYRNEAFSVKTVGVVAESGGIAWQRGTRLVPDSVFSPFNPGSGSGLLLSLPAGRNEISDDVLLLVESPGSRGATQTWFALLYLPAFVHAATDRLNPAGEGYTALLDQDARFLYHPDWKMTQEISPDRIPGLLEIPEDISIKLREGEEWRGECLCTQREGESRLGLVAISPVRSPLLPKQEQWSVVVVSPSTVISGDMRTIYLRHLLAEGPIIFLLFVVGVLGAVFSRQLSSTMASRINEQEGFMSSILQNTADAIMFLNLDLKVIVWNHGAESIFGYDADEMVGNNFRILVPPERDTEDEIEKILSLVHRGEHTSHVVIRLLRKDHSRLHAGVSLNQVVGQDGNIMGYTAVVRDISEQVQLDQRMYQTEKMASLGLLAAGVAHEINNPLAVILGFTDMLLEDTDRKSPAWEDLKTIEYNAQHAKDIVENLLGFARVTEGRNDRIDIRHSVQIVTNIVGKSLKQNKIDLKLQMDDTLPEAQGDPREFQQVLLNLINNAVAAMPDGGALILTARERGQMIQLDIEDSGEGIPNRIKPRIFDPFFTTKAEDEGTGLGLSLCYGIVTKYGGSITFRSVAREDRPREKSGTVFSVTMPKVAAATL